MQTANQASSTGCKLPPVSHLCLQSMQPGGWTWLRCEALGLGLRLLADVAGGSQGCFLFLQRARDMQTTKMRNMGKRKEIATMHLLVTLPTAQLQTHDSHMR